tara:strand:+ start:177 stop:782 length:606 start_codon:yes stop_codon:yes gene_type:complete
MKKLMENFRKFINEAPKELSKTTGLYLEDSLIVVYDYYGVKASIKRSLGSEEHMEKVDNAILGAMSLGFRSGNFVVEMVWAQRGYGPLLYRLALEQSSRYGLVPSRIKGEVSDAASSVWKEFYDGKGSEYARHEPAKEQIHGVEWLDAVYYPTSAVQDKDTSIALNKKVFNRTADPYEELETNFLEIAHSKLRDEMSKVGY